jgi:hypothetical protein
VDSTADGNLGVESFSVSISGAASFAIVTGKGAAGSPFGIYDDGSGQGSNTEVGFNSSRSATTAGSAIKASLTGSQDYPGYSDGSAEVNPVYGFGQSSGNLATAVPGTLGLRTTLANSASQTYNGPSTSNGDTFGLLLDTGTYTSTTPALLSSNDSITVWDSNGAADDPIFATTVLQTQTLAAVPEPTAPVILLVAALGLGLGRRRRRARAG